MPLKHATETFLVMILGAAIVLTGVVMAVLPPLPFGVVPWTVVFVLSVAYPVLLYPLFKRDRADYTFRLLHWFPAEMLLVWMLLQLLSLLLPPASFLTHWYTWAWSLVFVALGMLMLTRFCVQVLRRWAPRVTVLLLLLALAGLGGLSSERTGFDPAKKVTAWLGDRGSVEAPDVTGVTRDVREAGNDLVSSARRGWSSLAGLTVGKLLGWESQEAREEVAKELQADTEPRWWHRFTLAQLLRREEPVPEKNLEPSEDPSEERWRERLRALSDRAERLAQREEEAASESSDAVEAEPVATAEDEQSSRASIVAGIVARLPESLRPGGTGARLRESESVPSRLPQSGFGWGVVALSLLAGYTGKVHDRARRRK